MNFGKQFSDPASTHTIIQGNQSPTLEKEVCHYHHLCHLPWCQPGANLVPFSRPNPVLLRCTPSYSVSEQHPCGRRRFGQYAACILTHFKSYFSFFHVGNKSSNPVGDANKIKGLAAGDGSSTATDLATGFALGIENSR